MTISQRSRLRAAPTSQRRCLPAPAQTVRSYSAAYMNKGVTLELWSAQVQARVMFQPGKRGCGCKANKGGLAQSMAVSAASPCLLDERAAGQAYRLNRS